LVKRLINPYSPFQRIAVGLTEDPFIIYRSIHILSFLFSRGGKAEDMTDFIKLLIDRLSKARGRDILLMLRSIKDVLKNPETCLVFLKSGGLSSLKPYFSATNPTPQSMYVAGFCIWLISFDKDCLSELKDWEVIPKIADILKLVIPEKVVRIVFATLVNLVGKLTFNEEMIAAGLLKTADALLARKWKDEDIVADIEPVKAKLDVAIIALSSFERYQAEVLSGHLEWSPVHNPQFWRENSTKFEEKSFAIIESLIKLLVVGDELTIEVACYDIGEFARFHPDGKKFLQANNRKKFLMDKLSHKNPQIARQALTAVQKLMVTKWETLDKSNKNAQGGSEKSSQ